MFWLFPVEETVETQVGIVTSGLHKPARLLLALVIRALTHSLALVTHLILLSYTWVKGGNPF